MSARGLMLAIAAGVLVTADAYAMPVTGAPDKAKTARHGPAAARPVLAFTPASADPRLAAVFARGGLDTSGFRFTPAESRRDSRTVTVVVRARTNRPDTTRVAAAAEPNVGLAPIAYNLGASVGWKRVGIAGDVSHVDMAGQPGGREAADVTVSYSGDRVTGRVKGVVDRALIGAPSFDSDHSYALDVGGSYRLTRNLDVTAGVRYRSDRDRLVRLDDNRRDSQAVYVGTAFRF